jgi:hypothetical protein
MSEQLSETQFNFLCVCAREGPTGPSTDVGDELERRGLVSWVFEGRTLQGKWRLTDRGRDAMDAENKRRT